MTKIIAELGNTHEGSVGLAKAMIKSAAECGAHIVKFQTHLFKEESLDNAPNPKYFNGESRKAYFNRTSFTREEYVVLKNYCEEMKVEFMSSPFSIKALHLLDELDVNYIKIPSGEVTNLPLLREVAKIGRRTILSSGMSTYSELSLAIEELKKNGCKDLIVMQCTSMYPCDSFKVGLNNIAKFKEDFDVDVGFSDHTTSLSIPATAAYLGACIVEKHFTLSKQMYGSDAFNALEPAEFKEMVKNINESTLARDNPVDKDEIALELSDMKLTFEKSLVYASDFIKGQVLNEQSFLAKKPGSGVSPVRLDKFLGKKLKKNVQKDSLIEEGDFE